MRIISGIYGGRRLTPPKNITARPTTDFAKESLFNLLNSRLKPVAENLSPYEGIDVLDLFAGTGGISFEFASRGARDVTAVELAHTQQNFIISVCKKLNCHNVHLVRADVFKYVRACNIQYDFIYADPPYALEQLPTLPDLIFEHELLKPNGLFVLEHSKANDFSSHPHWTQTRVYGSVHFSFFR